MDADVFVMYLYEAVKIVGTTGPTRESSENRKPSKLPTLCRKYLKYTSFNFGTLCHTVIVIEQTRHRLIS